MNPTRIDVGDVLGRTWAIFKREWGKCLVALLLVWLISVGFNVVVSIGFNVAGAISGDRFVAFVCTVMGTVVSALFGVWIGIGQTIYFLKVARGQRADLADIFSGAPHFWPILGASILFVLITFLGYILCIVPGVILALMFMQFYFLILDRRLGVMDSLSYSNQIMQGNKLKLFVIILVAVLLGAAVVVCTCGIGLLAVLPFWALLFPVVYLAITGQPTADRLAAGMTRP